jgi:serine phosphatase RsbU (regulator of sigma subunit)
LEKLAILLGVALQNVELASQIVKDALLAKDLKTASEMQASLFPTFEQCNEVVGRVIPARNLSGDFIEFVQIGDEIIFCAGDVAGKGIPAALTVARCLAIFDLLAKQKASIDVIAKQMNSELIASNFRQASLASFVTFFIGKIHLNTRNLEYINCGHGDQLVFDDEKNHEIISSSMPPLGVVANDLFAPCTSRCDLQNKRLFVFSDGITEATRNGKEIGFQGVKTIVSALYSENSQNLLAKFMSVFDVGALVTSDDASMIIVG